MEDSTTSAQLKVSRVINSVIKDVTTFVLIHEKTRSDIYKV